MKNPFHKITPAERRKIDAQKRRLEKEQSRAWGARRLSQEEKDLRAAIRKEVLPAFKKEQELIKLRQAAKEHPPGFKTAPGSGWVKVSTARRKAFKGDINGPGARYVKAVVGPEVFEAALQKYGDNVIIRASKVAMELRQDRDRETAKKVSKLRDKLSRKLTAQDIDRYLPRPPKSVKIPEYQLIPYGKQKKGGYKTNRYTVGRKGFDAHGKRVWVPVTVKRDGRLVRPIYRGVDKAKRALNRTWYRKSYRAQVANVLGLSLREVGPLVALVEKQAQIDLAKFKRTASYQKLKQEKPRMAAGMTLKKWMGAGIAALYGLADISTYL